MVPAELLGSVGFSYDGGEGRARLFFVISLMLTFGGLTAAIVCRLTGVMCPIKVFGVNGLRR